MIEYRPKPLSLKLNQAVQNVSFHVTRGRWRVFDQGLDGGEAPATLADVKSAYYGHGKCLIIDGSHADTSIYDDVEINHAFRAWHDARHITENAEFDFAGECRVYAAQARDLIAYYGDNNWSRWACTVLCAEIVGQAEYRIAKGDFPDNQLWFTKLWLRDHAPGLLEPK